MRFLADENFPMPSIINLREAGHDVAAIVETDAGATDEAVLSRAVQEMRILLTFDRDHGALIFVDRLPAPTGVIYFRFVSASPQEPAERLIEIIESASVVFEKQFTVIGSKQIRQRPLPE